MTKKLLTIDELAKEAKVPTRTIRFYTQNKLLDPPKEFRGRRTALYGLEYVQKIRLIKTLQDKYFLPLAVIKEILADPKKLIDSEKRLSFDKDVLAILKYEAPTVSEKELSKIAGLDLKTIKQLEKIGFLLPTVTEAGKVYPVDGLQMAILLKKLLKEGFKVKELVFYPEMILRFVKTGFSLSHEKFKDEFEKNPEKIAPTVARINKTNEELLILLYRQLLQQESKEFQINRLKQEIGTSCLDAN